MWIVTCSCTQASWWLQEQPQCFMPVLVSTLIAAARAQLWSSFGSVLNLLSSHTLKQWSLAS